MMICPKAKECKVPTQRKYEPESLFEAFLSQTCDHKEEHKLNKFCTIGKCPKCVTVEERLKNANNN